MTAQHNLAITRGPSSFKPPAMRFGGWSFSGSAAACATRVLMRDYRVPKEVQNRMGVCRQSDCRQ